MSIERPNPRTTTNPGELPPHIQRVGEAFDNTSLPQAHAEGLVDNQVPDLAQEVIDTASPETANFIEAPAQKEKERKLLSRRNFLLAGLGIAGVVAVEEATRAIVGASTRPDAKPAPTAGSEKSASAAATSGETGSPAPSEQELNVKSLELDGSLTPEQLAKTFGQDRLSSWNMAGATEANLNKYLDLGAQSAFPREIAEKNGEIYADALLVPGWRSDAALNTFVNGPSGQKTLNALAIEMNFITHYDKSSNIKDKEPYWQTVSIDSTTVISQTADTVVTTSAATQHTNEAKNSAVDHDPQHQKHDGSKFTVYTTFKLIDGKWKVSALQMASR
ncbi:hypothetical protein [Psychromicrobium xiongbiense]|uniref:hypothetical protein n=1 Tax=Psychromicrobium xiongbiense TaxID=3051184 RepID=UPI002555B60E|nr:hypothetical protein [Psychromicrobium sp. YIM S02556]